MLTLGRPSSTRWILENCSGSELFTADEKSKAFSQIATKAKEYSEALVERWVKEIDTYLVYAGLFSAILTAFNVESYQLLQPSLPDTSSDILQHISLQLSSLSYIPPFINSTRPAFNSHDVRSTASAVVPQWAVWLNTLWFSSLILSLSSASVGIFVKQWLNEFQSGLSGDSEHVARLRQHRLNNLERCHVESIVNAIPVLLQGALALFLAGLLVLLWMLHRTVAGIASLFVLGIALFIVATSIGPMLTAHCAYLSPQSLALYALLSRVACIIRQKLLATKACLFRLLNKEAPERSSDDHNHTAFYWQPWAAREHITVYSSSRELEADMCNTVYGATLDSDIVVSATIRLVDWDAQVVFSWFGRLVEMDTFHFGKCQDHFKLNNDYLYGAIFYCIILLYSMGEPSIAERFFANSASLQKDTIVAGFCECLDLLRYHIPQDVHEALPRWGEQVAWLLDTHAALHAREDKGHSDGHLEPSSLLSPPCQERLQSNRLDLTSTILDIEVIPESYKYKRISCIEFYATSAFHLLRASGYSPDKPFERIGAYLRAHAVLLNATATRPLWDPSNLEEPLDEALKDALSDLITALDSLARAGLDDLVDIADVRTDIIRPIAGIVDALSRKPDSFLPLLAPRFCTSLEAFFEALKQSVLFDDDYAIWVPGAVRTPSDLYDSARELIAKIRGQSGQSHNTHSLQPVDPLGDDLTPASTLHVPCRSATTSEPLAPTTTTP